MIVRQGVVELAAELIPHAILAVFSRGDNQVVCGVPIASKDDSIVGLPADLLVSRQGRLDDQVLVATVKDGVTVGRPDQAVNWFAALDDLSSEHALL